MANGSAVRFAVGAGVDPVVGAEAEGETGAVLWLQPAIVKSPSARKEAMRAERDGVGRGSVISVLLR
jgi:hypothetical protein